MAREALQCYKHTIVNLEVVAVVDVLFEKTYSASLENTWPDVERPCAGQRRLPQHPRNTTCCRSPRQYRRRVEVVQGILFYFATVTDHFSLGGL